MHLNAITLLRSSYLGAALAVLLVAFIPPLRDRFLSYGARASEAPLSSAEKEKQKQQAKDKQKAHASKSILSSVLDGIAEWQVPHDWFWTFYALSVTLSAFWPGEAMWLHGPLYKALRDGSGPFTTTMTFEQVKITAVMMLAHGARRLYESLVLVDWEEFGTDKKQSMMFGGHWVLGLLFYIATSIAIWIEGIPVIEAHDLSVRDLIFRAPTMRTIFSVLIFILASGFQYDCHAYLAYLKRNPAPAESAGPPSSNTRSAHPTTSKDATADGEGDYKLPTHPAFQPLICPHYSAECFIYLSLALVSAPQGALINGTMACALVFVTVNLGVTAEGTKRWYERRFGSESTRGKWRMFPPVY